MNQPQISEGKSQHPSGRPKAKPRGRPFPPGNNANPEGRRLRSKRFSEIFDAIAQDYGGEACLTGLQRVGLTEATRLIVRAQREKNPDIAVRLMNASARLLVGVARKTMDARKNTAPKPPKRTLQEHLERLAHEQAGAADDEGGG
jgi:hypothetical protein